MRIAAPYRLLPCWWSFSVSPLWIALQELWTSSVNTPSEVVVKLESWRFRFNGKGLVHIMRMVRIMHMVLTQAAITQALANCWQIWNDLKWGESQIGLLNFIFNDSCRSHARDAWWASPRHFSGLRSTASTIWWWETWRRKSWTSWEVMTPSCSICEWYSMIFPVPTVATWGFTEYFSQFTSSVSRSWCIWAS